MSIKPPSLPAPQGNVFRQTLFRARLILRLIRDRRVPWYIKLIPVGGLLYVLFPFDLIPDLAIGFGQIDDVGIFLGSLWLFEELCPADVVKEHWDDLMGLTIKGSWRDVTSESLPGQTAGGEVPVPKAKSAEDEKVERK